MIALIDADFLKYLVAYDISKLFDTDLPMLAESTEVNYSTVCSYTEKRIQYVFKGIEEKATGHIFLFSGKTRDNYRAQIASARKYKGKRNKKPSYPQEKEHMSMVEMYVKENYNYHKEDDLEADDLCVMAHTENTFIYSHDKDLNMSPGVHYDIKAKKFVKTTVREGFRTLLIQAMSGDSVDNIQGLQGVGQVKATELLEFVEKDEDAVNTTVGAFMKKYGVKDGLDRFVEMYTLVNLKTSRGDWTKEKYSEFFDKINKLVNPEKISDLI